MLIVTNRLNQMRDATSLGVLIYIDKKEHCSVSTIDKMIIGNGNHILVFHFLASMSDEATLNLSCVRNKSTIGKKMSFDSKKTANCKLRIGNCVK